MFPFLPCFCCTLKAGKLFLDSSMLLMAATREHLVEIKIIRKEMPRLGFETGLLRTQHSVLTTIQSRLGSFLE